MSTLRLASFNCENLFSRASVYRQSPQRAAELLGYLAQLQAELRKQTFDHDEIDRLKNELIGFAAVVDIRGSHENAGGASQWLGWVELTRGEVNDVAVRNTARVIADINADVICLIEVEDRLLLQKFHDNLLLPGLPGGRGYEHVLLIDGNTSRGIDVAIMSRAPVLWLRSHIHERTDVLPDPETGGPIPLFSRDCLEVGVEAPDGRTLHLMVNHFKSMRTERDDDPGGGRLRRAQAARVAELVGGHDLASEYVVVAGDLNSEPDSPSLAPLMAAGLYNVNDELPAGRRGTYLWRENNSYVLQQLDYLLVSPALRGRLRAVDVERRGAYPQQSGFWTPYQSVTSKRTQASDHAGVFADFDF